MRADVMMFVGSCDLCLKIKSDTKAPMGKLQLLPIPDLPWSVIGLDFVVKLPLSQRFDSVLVVVDHSTKGAHFIPRCESINAADLASLFIQQFFLDPWFTRKHCL